MENFQIIKSAQGQNPTIKNKELLNAWQKWAEVKPQSFATYTRALKIFLKFLGGRNLHPADASRDDLLDYRDGFLADKKPATKALYLQAVKLFYRWAKNSGFFENNNAEKLKIHGLRQGDFKKDFLTADAAKRLLNSKTPAPNSDIDTEPDNEPKNIAKIDSELAIKRDRAILAVMLTAGLRTCEVSRADLGDFDFQNGERILRILGKGRVEKTQFVKIPPQVESIILTYLNARQAAEGKFAKIGKSAPLFAVHANRNRGGRIATRSISFLVKSALRNCGLNSPRLTAHSLRHTFAVLNLENGASLEETRQVLRHDSIKTTQIYSHAVERLKNKSEGRVAAILFN